MARPGLTKHRKFLKLARLVGSRLIAMGALELIWQRAYEHGPDLGERLDVEFGVDWDGEPGALASALIESGFVDEQNDGSLVVHDLLDHAPKYVQERFARERGREERGETISGIRAEAGRKGAKKRWQAHGKCVANTKQPIAPPFPSHPIEDQDQGRLSPAATSAPDETPNDDGFEAFWGAYPRHTDKAAARKAWRALKPSPPLREIILAAVADQRTWRTWADAKFIPHAATWLHHARWDDERPMPDCLSSTHIPVNGTGWCREHDPPCHTQQEHTAKVLAEGRAAREAVSA